MNVQGFFSELGIDKDRVFFESTKEDKIKKIQELNCSHYIDDLIEILTHPEFPKSAKKIFFSEAQNNNDAKEIHTFNNWHDLSVEYLKNVK